MKKIFTLLLILFTFCLVNCQNEAIDRSADGTANAGGTEKGGEVTLRVGVNLSGSVSRAALPTVDENRLTYIYLSYYDPADEVGYHDVGSWNNINDMRDAVLPFKTGEYSFSLIAMCTGMMFTDKKTQTITAGENRLTFTPRLEILTDEFHGKGDLNVTLDLSCDMTDIKNVTAGLYSMAETAIIGAEDKDLTIDEIVEIGHKKSWVNYTLENVPSGDYVVIFKFYADEDNTRLLGTYREYTSIINDMTSDSECVIEAIGRLFAINYDKNGGEFKDGYKPPVSYTRQMGNVTLPASDEIVKANHIFGGWYDNAEFNGEAVKNITTGNTGDKTYYAKWIPEVTIIFSPNGGTIRRSEMVVIKDQTADLPTINTLGLVSPTQGHFIGWAKFADASEIDYADGAKVRFSENIILYAIWSISNIHPENASDTSDDDGDGLSDWEELNVWHTDPSNPDTDGDGWNDKDETGLYSKNEEKFNPLVADVPLLDIVFEGNPAIYYLYETSTTTGNSEEVSTTDGTTRSVTDGSSHTKSREETHGWEFGAEYSYSWQSGQKGASVAVHGNYSGSVARGDEYSYSKEMSEEFSKEWSNTRSTSSETGKSVSGGKIVIPLRFKNPSNIAYTVENATIAIGRTPTNSSEAVIPIEGRLIENVGTITPKGQSGIYNVSVELDLENTENLLKWSSGINLQVSGYKIAMSGGREDFTEALTKVKAQTAAVYIDWGVGSGYDPVTYNVAVKNQYNMNATSIENKYLKSSLKYIFDTVLCYKENTDYVLDNGMLKEIYRIANGNDYKAGGWFISHHYTKQGKRLRDIYSPFSNEGYNLANIQVSVGDEISIIYCVDNDGDGVPLHEERFYGTSDTTDDTDGDGLTDKEEIYGWYKSDIGLDAKYSDENKIYTSPVLKDSDGDDLFDYINNYDTASDEEKSKVDNDPLFPKMKNDTSLKVIEYSKTSGASFTPFSFDGNRKASLSGLNEYLYLNIKPKLAFGKVEYKIGNAGNYSPVDKYTAIGLMVGTNTIYIKSTAPDQETSVEYTISAVSEFRSMKNFKVGSERLGGGVTTFNWDSYSDDRAAKSDGGYVLYVKKVDSLKTYDSQIPDVALTRINATGTGENVNNPAALPEFRVKLSAAILKAGNTTFALTPNSNYFFYLYAYAHDESDSTFQSKCLAKSQIKTGKKPKGELHFYAHYIYDWKDQDGGCDPEYYWTFKGGLISDISSLNIGSDEKKEMDDDDDKSYCFGEKKMHKYKNDPAKYSECTKVITQEFSREKDISFSITWEAMEYDCGSPDDKVGTVFADFYYNAATDTWSCSWQDTRGDQKKSTVTAGERTGKINGSHKSGNRWELHNSDEGEIEFHWDWGWDDENPIPH